MGCCIFLLSRRPADNLKEAQQTIEECLKVQDNLQCLWKLLGDVHTMHYHLPVLPAEVSQPHLPRCTRMLCESCVC